MSVRFLVSGRVQGVGFRAATLARARELGLTGTVRNLSDGRVEVITSGAAAAVESLAEWLWQGPPEARVAAVAAEDVAAVSEAGFVIAG